MRKRRRKRLPTWEFIQSVQNSFCRVPVLFFKTSREDVLYEVCVHGSTTSPALSGSISPLGAREADGGGVGGGTRRCLCYVCFGTLRVKNRVGQPKEDVFGWGLMFWHFRWCAGTWGGRARPVRDRGKTQSRHRRSRSCGCRGSWGNTALLGHTGPDTPVGTHRGKQGRNGLDNLHSDKRRRLEEQTEEQ